MIKVRAAQADGKVVFWERHRAHPDNEAFVAGDGKVHEVGQTPRVTGLIERGALVVVEDEKPQEPPTAPPPIEDYDDMNVESIVAAMAEMSDEEVTALKEYEAAHKARKGILEA